MTPETGTTEYDWNTDGTLEEKRDAKGQKVQYDYDEHKRITEMRAYESDGTTLEQSVAYTYDANVLGGYYLGRLSKVEYGPDVSGTRKYTENFEYSKGGLAVRKRWDLRLPGSPVAPLSETERRDFWEICEDRYQVRSTILSSQVPVAKWHDQIGDPTLADGILDRLVHNAHRIEIRGESMRKKRASKPAR